MADFGDDRTILVPGEELLVLCACPPEEPDPLNNGVDAQGVRVVMSCDDGANCWTPFLIPDEPSVDLDGGGPEVDADPFARKPSVDLDECVLEADPFSTKQNERAVTTSSEQTCWAPFTIPARPGDATETKEPASSTSTSPVSSESELAAEPLPSRKVFSSGNSARLIWTTDSNGRLVQEHTEEPHPKAESKEETPETPLQSARMQPHWVATKPSPNRSLEYQKPKSTSLACQCAIA